MDWCTKKKFPFQGAEIVLEKTRNYKNKRDEQECRYYFCEQCQAYHLTSIPEKAFAERLRNGTSIIS
jgi:hypothetical protein